VGSEELGIIEKITIYPAKGEAGKELAEARLVKDLGVEGDCYAKGGERQITLMFADNGDESNTKEKGLCSARFKENILIKFPEDGKRRPAKAEDWPPFLSPGTRLAMGEAVLEMSGETKHCHEECPLFQAGKRCFLAGQNLFARVAKNGVIRTGDGVNILY
jgi:MOSC domain-containing protein YiiM